MTKELELTLCVIKTDFLLLVMYLLHADVSFNDARERASMIVPLYNILNKDCSFKLLQIISSKLLLF